MAISPQAWRHWYLRIFPAYWIFLALMTHLPRPQIPGAIPYQDKWLHLLAFGGLAFLGLRFRQSWKAPTGAGLRWKAAIVLVAYASLDELTQQFVGRQTALLDWLANVTGIVIVLIMTHHLERRRAGSAGRSVESAPNRP
ncbi:MAG: VanZ family protein [Phycisphaerae bacterium]|jgi:VanZ family protein